MEEKGEAANAQRAKGLSGTGALSAQQQGQFEVAEAVARARVATAQASVAAQELRLQHTRVVAPDAGLVSARSATLGAVPGAGQDLFRLIRQGRLEWRAEVPAAELHRVKPGTAARLTTPSGALVQGTVRKVSPSVDPQTRNGLVYVDVTPVATPGQPARAMAGMFARGEFQLGATPALTVPQSALVVRDGFSYVMQVGEGDRVSARKVQTGRIAGDRVEIIGGLDAQARVVASGGSFLNDGDVVRIAATPAAATASAPRTPAPGASAPASAAAAK